MKDNQTRTGRGKKIRLHQNDISANASIFQWIILSTLAGQQSACHKSFVKPNAFSTFALALYTSTSMAAPAAGHARAARQRGGWVGGDAAFDGGRPSPSGTVVPDWFHNLLLLGCVFFQLRLRPRSSAHFRGRGSSHFKFFGLPGNTKTKIELTSLQPWLVNCFSKRPEKTHVYVPLWPTANNMTGGSQMLVL